MAADGDLALALRLQQEEWTAAAGGIDARDSSDVPAVHSVAEFDARLAAAGPCTPVVVDFHAAWCGPCKAIAPFVAQLSSEYAGRALFLKVDVDEVSDLTQRAGIRAMPTFHIYLGGERVEEMTGANSQRLHELIRQCCDRADTARAAAQQNSSAVPAAKKHAPETIPVMFADGAPDRMAAKLAELNAAVTSQADGLGSELSTSQLGSVKALCARLAAGPAPAPGGQAAAPPVSEADAEAARASLAALEQVLTCWPPGMVFPAADVLRLAVLRPAERTAVTARGSELVRAVLDSACSEAAGEAAQMLGLRFFANCCIHSSTAKLVTMHREAVVDRCYTLRAADRPGTRVAAAAVMHNFAMVLSDEQWDFDTRTHLLSAAASALADSLSAPGTVGAVPSPNDAEVAFRLALALDALCAADEECAQYAQGLSVHDSAALGAESGLASAYPKVRDALLQLVQRVKEPDGSC